MKANLEQLGLYGPAKIRISRSLCLGRCALGPSMVIYPEGTWYRYQSLADIDLIIQESLIHNRVIEHLLINEL